MATRDTTMREFRVEFALHASIAVPRESLDELAIAAEEALTAALPDSGASASAVYAEDCIEFDLILSAASPARLHGQIAEVMQVLEDNGFAMADLVSSNAVASHQRDDELVCA